MLATICIPCRYPYPRLRVLVQDAYLYIIGLEVPHLDTLIIALNGPLLDLSGVILWTDLVTNGLDVRISGYPGLGPSIYAIWSPHLSPPWTLSRLPPSLYMIPSMAIRVYLWIPGAPYLLRMVSVAAPIMVISRT